MLRSNSGPALFLGGGSMLIRLFGENFRSFRDPFELSFVAADLKAEGDRGVSLLYPDGSDEPFSVLRCIGVFGANASGKSTVLLAAKALLWMIRQSSRKLEPEKEIPWYEPFAFCSTARERPVRLGCTIFLDGVFYEYELTYSRHQIESERLVRLDEPEEPLLERGGPTNVGGRIVKASHHVKALLAQPRANTPIFSFLAQHGSEHGEFSVRPFWKAFCDRLGYRDYSGQAGSFPFQDLMAKRLYRESDFRHWVMAHLIRPADLGIQNVQVEEIEFPPFLSGAPEEVRKQFADEAPFYRAAFSHFGEHNANLDLSEESAGTRKMYDLASDWWALAHKPVTILGDELTASLHPVLIDHLVRAVNHRAHEGDAYAQLAFATHEVGLLESRGGSPPALRRDQIYFTEKDDSGASTLSSLAEFKDEARSVHNLRKRYLGDRYGAIPRIEELLF